MQEKKEIQNPKIQEVLKRRKTARSIDEHNMEFVAEIRGVTYINDSRALMVQSTLNSIQSIQAPVVLIIGGSEDISDYSILSEVVKMKVKAVIYMGKEKGRIFKLFYNSLSIMFVAASSLDEAVVISSLCGVAGDVVLFSPACPYDTVFPDYKSRGNEFKKIIKQLADK